MIIVWLMQVAAANLLESTFRVLVPRSLVPAVLSVLSLALGAKDVPVTKLRPRPKFAFRSLGKPFMIFMGIVGLFTLGNSADAFLVLRAKERGSSVVGVLGMLITFNLVYTLISTPAGSLSDRIGRRKLIIGGWLAYAVIYLGFGLAQTGWQIGSCTRLRRLLRPGVRHGYGDGGRSGARERARHGLRHVQRRTGPHGFSRVADRRHPLAGGGAGRVWSLGAVHLRRRAGAIAAGLMAAWKSPVISNVNA